MAISRRLFLRGAAATTSTLLLPRWASSQTVTTRLVLLGTAGGPRPRSTRSAPAQVIVANGAAYVVDCGDGVARQLVLAGIPLPSIRHVLLTHQHSDHNADYGTLLLLAWTAGLRTPVRTWGPPPLQEMTRSFFAMNEYDITTRIADEGRVPLEPLINPQEVTIGGPLFEDEHLRVSAALVDHPPVVPALAYRFDGPDRSIVVSGDTRPSNNLIELARGADVLVHEVLYDSAAVDRLVVGLPNAGRLKESIMAHHTTAEEVGRVAQAAGVRTLVLSHLVPAEDPTITDEMWIAAARRSFDGQIIVGHDLLVI